MRLATGDNHRRHPAQFPVSYEDKTDGNTDIRETGLGGHQNKLNWMKMTLNRVSLFFNDSYYSKL
jgi:hypothetical protein